MSYFGVSLRNGVGLGLGTVPSLTNTPLSYRLAPSLNLSFAGSDTLDPRITFSRTTNATLTNSAGLVAYAPHNLLTYSEQFDNAAWLAARATISANTAVAPDGTTTADTLVEDTTNNSHPMYRTVAGFTTTAYTLSCYIKANVRTQGRIAFASTAFPASPYVNFDLSAVTASGANGATGTITAVGNGWYRCTVTATAGAAGNGDVYIQPLLANATNYLGTGANALYIWGAQLELGSTATTYNPTTVKNLLGFTEHFDNAAWTKSNASISATKVDDIYGQPFAQKLVENTNTSVHRVDSNAPVLAGNAPHTFSFYAKAAERTEVYGLISATTAGSRTLVRFDLSNETVVVVSGAPTSTSVHAIGSGWYRCAITYTTAASPTFTSQIIGIWNGTEVYTGDGTSGIYIWGAQLSDSASVDPYVYNPVAAPTDQAYYGPRFDYDPVTLAPKGLLIEEQRTNLLTYSEQFDNAAWTKTRCSVTANIITAPDGLLTGDKLVENTDANTHFLTATIALSDNVVHTASVYMKAAERLWGYITVVNKAASNRGAYFNLSTGTVGTVTAGETATITDVGNGWYRCTLTLNVGTGATTPQMRVWTANGDGSSNYTGNGTSGMFIWGAQLEAGAFVTSYTPTVASQVTRAADSASMIGNNFARWYNQTEGTLFGDVVFNSASVPADQLVFQVDNGSNDQRNKISRYAGMFYGTTRITGSKEVDMSLGTATGNTAYKVDYAYKVNDFAGTSNVGTVATDTSGAVPVPLTTANIGRNGVGGEFLNGTIKRIAYYNRRLSNTELQGITS